MYDAIVFYRMSVCLVCFGVLYFLYLVFVVCVFQVYLNFQCYQ